MCYPSFPLGRIKVVTTTQECICSANKLTVQGLEIRFPSVDQLPGSRVKLIQNVLPVCVVISVGAGRAQTLKRGERNGMRKKRNKIYIYILMSKIKRRKKSHFVFSRKNIFIMPRIMEQPREKKENEY